MPLLTDIPNYFKKTFKGATAISAGLIGLVPAPGTGQQNAVLKGNSTWASLSASDVGAAPATGIDPTAITGTAVVDSDPRLTDSRTPSSHASSHASSGSDPLAPSDIGAMPAFVASSVTITSTPHTLTAGRAQRVTVATVVNATTELVLPTSSNQQNDVIQVIRGGNSGANQEILIKNAAGGSTLATLKYGTDDSFTFRYQVGANSWFLVPVDAHSADKVISGTLDIARIPTGTGSTEVAAGDHVHGNLTSDGKLGSTSGLPLVTTTAGAVTTLALGTAGQVLTVNGTADGVEFAAASGGVSAVNSTLADILSVSGSDLVADDLGSDKLYGWDDSASKAIGFTVSTGLETDGTNLKAKITSDPTGVSGADAITNIMSLTQAEYDAIGSPSASTLYIITDP